MPAQSPKELHEMFAKAMSAADAEALLALYEQDAALVPPGSGPSDAVRGENAMRGLLSSFTAMNPSMTMETEAIEAGDLALLFGSWTLSATGPDGGKITMTGTSAEVARRQPDGSWRLVIDHPTGVK
jgi:ketosteroid isomerase-like protein